MDHRLAFAGLVALLIATGTPLAFAWARLLPEDAPPFPIEPGSFPSVDHEIRHVQPSRNLDYVVGAPLLLCATIAFVFRVPGFPSGTVLAWFGNTIPGLDAYWSVIGVRVIVTLVAVAIGVFGALRPGPLRIPLIIAGALILVLWFIGPLLETATLSGT